MKAFEALCFTIKRKAKEYISATHHTWPLRQKCFAPTLAPWELGKKKIVLFPDTWWNTIHFVFFSPKMFLAFWGIKRQNWDMKLEIKFGWEVWWEVPPTPPPPPSLPTAKKTWKWKNSIRCTPPPPRPVIFVPWCPSETIGGIFCVHHNSLNCLTLTFNHGVNS